MITTYYTTQYYATLTIDLAAANHYYAPTRRFEPVTKQPPNTVTYKDVLVLNRLRPNSDHPSSPAHFCYRFTIRFALINIFYTMPPLNP
jgi:hypothetical protein